MNKRYGILTAAALAVGGMAFIGCHNNNPDTAPSASAGGMSGGGSTDSYGTGPGARLRSTGNIGMDSGAAQSNNVGTPQPAAGDQRAIDNQPPQTPEGPGGTTTTGNGTVQAGTAADSNSAPRANDGKSNRSTDSNNNATKSSTPSNNANGNSGAVLGGTNGNGTTNTGANVGGPSTPTR